MGVAVLNLGVFDPASFETTHKLLLVLGICFLYLVFPSQACTLLKNTLVVGLIKELVGYNTFTARAAFSSSLFQPSKHLLFP